jgi:hypothetical protein
MRPAYDTALVVHRQTRQQRALAGQLGGAIWHNALEARAMLQRDAVTWGCAHLSRRDPFVLVPADDRETLDIRCAADLFPISVFVCEKGSTGPAVVRNAYTVDSVLVPPKHRGNGCAFARTSSAVPSTRPPDASQTAVKLYAHLRKHCRTDDEAAPVALLGFSDCGECIWRPVGRTSPARELTWSVADYAPLDEAAPDAADLGYLDFSAALALADTDADLLATKLAAFPRDRTRFCVRPSRDLFEAALLHARETLRHRLGPGRPLGPHVGVRLLDAQAYVLWIHHVDDAALVFLRFEAPDARAARRLLRCAAEEARWWGLRRMVAWDVVEAVVAGTRATATERTFNLPVAAWLGEADSEDEVEWRFIERFAVVLES